MNKRYYDHAEQLIRPKSIASLFAFSFKIFFDSHFGNGNNMEKIIIPISVDIQSIKIIDETCRAGFVASYECSLLSLKKKEYKLTSMLDRGNHTFK